MNLLCEFIDEKTDPLKGLTTKVALGRLYDDIQKVLDSHEQKVKERLYKFILYNLYFERLIEFYF